MPGRETSIGGPGGAFPETLWTVLEEARELPQSGARERLDQLVRAYWKPVYRCVRAGWGRGPEESKDLTQAFFTWLLSEDVLRKVERGRGRFRGFLRASLRNWLANRHRHDRQIKRGGGRPVAALEAVGADPASPEPPPDEQFDREWARALLEDAMEEFERRVGGKPAEVLKAYQGAEGDEGPRYESVAAATGLTRDAVKHHLARARDEIRAILVERIKSYALDDAELQQEVELLRSAWQ